MMSQNWVRTTQDEGIKRVQSAGPSGGGWHVDDLIHFPLPDHVEAHMPDVAPPVFVLQVFVLLTNVETLEHGCVLMKVAQASLALNSAGLAQFALRALNQMSCERLFSPAVPTSPTQFVPGSHLSGRLPNDQQEPIFQGAGPISMLGLAGDAYIMNNQIWHRGSPNLTSQARILGGTTYCKRFISQRLFPHVDYVLPKRVLRGAGPRLQRMLGRHDKGSYA